MEFDDAVKAYGALAQNTRLDICKLLADKGDGGMPAGDIALALGVAQNTMSFHLSHLERAGLIKSRRQGRFIIYAADSRFVDELILFTAQTCRSRK